MFEKPSDEEMVPVTEEQFMSDTKALMVARQYVDKTPSPAEMLSELEDDLVKEMTTEFDWTACVMTHDLRYAHTFLAEDQECFTEDTRTLFKVLESALYKWGIAQRPVSVQVLATHLDKCIDLTFSYTVYEDRVELEDR